MALTWYSKEVRKVKHSSRRKYCQGIKDLCNRARLMMIMATHLDNRMGCFELPDS
jgi:hypothetical protein